MALKRITNSFLFSVIFEFVKMNFNETFIIIKARFYSIISKISCIIYFKWDKNIQVKRLKYFEIYETIIATIVFKMIRDTKFYSLFFY